MINDRSSIFAFFLFGHVAATVDTAIKLLHRTIPQKWLLIREANYGVTSENVVLFLKLDVHLNSFTLDPMSGKLVCCLCFKIAKLLC